MAAVKTKVKEGGSILAILESLHESVKGAPPVGPSDSTKVTKLQVPAGEISPCPSFSSLKTIKEVQRSIDELGQDLCDGSEQAMEESFKRQENAIRESMTVIVGLTGALKQSVSQVRSTKNMLCKREEAMRRKSEEALQKPGPKGAAAAQAKNSLMVAPLTPLTFKHPLIEMGHQKVQVVSVEDLPHLLAEDGAAAMPYIVQGWSLAAQDTAKLDIFAQGMEDSETVRKTGKTLRRWQTEANLRTELLPGLVPTMYVDENLYSTRGEALESSLPAEVAAKEGDPAPIADVKKKEAAAASSEKQHLQDQEPQAEQEGGSASKEEEVTEKVANKQGDLMVPTAAWDCLAFGQAANTTRSGMEPFGLACLRLHHSGSKQFVMMPMVDLLEAWKMHFPAATPTFNTVATFLKHTPADTLLTMAKKCLWLYTGEVGPGQAHFIPAGWVVFELYHSKCCGLKLPVAQRLELLKSATSWETALQVDTAEACLPPQEAVAMCLLLKAHEKATHS